MLNIIEHVLIRSINIIIEVIIWAIIIRSLLSIVIRDSSHPAVTLLNSIVEPIVSPFRKLIEKLNVNTGMIDFSPLLAIIFLQLVKRLIFMVI